MDRTLAPLTVVLMALFGAASPAFAQDETEETPAPPPAASGGSTIEWRVAGGASYQFETDIDDGGEFDLFRAGVGVSAAYDWTPDLRFNAAVGYEYDSYDFSGSRGFGGLDPWDDVDSLRVRVGLRYRIDEQWAVVGGPVLSFSAEDGASFSNSATAGGIVGASYRASDTFTIGFGVGVFGQIDDDTKVLPFVTFNWQAADNFAVRSSQFELGANAKGGGGLEAAWDLSDTWEIAVGAQYQTRRFRLDDDGIAPDGVGETTAVPIYVGSTWKCTPALTVSAFAGVVVGGNLRLENDGGHKITDEDYDPAPIVGARVSFTF